jgi:hypothetical protein
VEKAVRGSKEQSWKMKEAVMRNRDGNSDNNGLKCCGDMIGFWYICPLVSLLRLSKLSDGKLQIAAVILYVILGHYRP